LVPLAGLRFVLAGALSLLLAVWFTTTGSMADTTDGIPAGTRLAASVLTDPTPVRGTDGLLHIAYELVLTNGLPQCPTAIPQTPTPEPCPGSQTISIDQIDVLNSDTREVLLSLAGSMLSANMYPLRLGEPPRSPPYPGDTTIATSAVSIVFLDVQLDDNAPIPQHLEHRTFYHLLDRPPPASPVHEIVARIETDETAPPALSPPLGKGIWLASEGCCSDVTHHRRSPLTMDGDLEINQRFAIDWYLLDAQHRAWVGDPTKLTSYFSYGQPVFAAADGKVVNAPYNDLRDNPNVPGDPPIALGLPLVHGNQLQEALGNHVVLQIGQGVFVVYCHMMQGSLLVKEGQRVRQGQMLGQIGSSGNANTPHLHFQISTTPTVTPGDSRPYVFKRFNLVGQVTERLWDENFQFQPTGVLPFAPAQPPSRHQLELPLDRNVIIFSESP